MLAHSVKPSSTLQGLRSKAKCCSNRVVGAITSSRAVVTWGTVTPQGTTAICHLKISVCISWQHEVLQKNREVTVLHLMPGQLLWAEPSSDRVQFAQIPLHHKETLLHSLWSYPESSSPCSRVGSPHHAWVTPHADGSMWKLGSNRRGSPYCSWLEVNPVRRCQLWLNSTQRSNVCQH